MKVSFAVLLALLASHSWTAPRIFGASPPADRRGNAAGLDSRDEIVRGLTEKDAKPSNGPVEFTIASYNVQCRPVMDKPDEKLPLISPRLTQFDVALIQECFTRHDLLWAKADFPNKVYFGRLASPFKIAGSGLSTLSRLPMGEVVSEHYRDVGELQNRVASKGILLARMRIAGVAVDVYNTHMEAGDKPEAQTARRGQAKQVIQFVSKNSPADHAVLLMGDFNMGPRRGDKPWREYSPNHYSTEADMLARTEAFETMRQGLNLRDVADELLGQKDDGIERLLFREGSRCRIEPLRIDVDRRGFRRADGSSLSDGSPLVVRLRMNAK